MPPLVRPIVIVAEHPQMAAPETTYIKVHMTQDECATSCIFVAISRNVAAVLLYHDHLESVA
jgi:hypothetical protein